MTEPIYARGSQVRIGEIGGSKRHPQVGYGLPGTLLPDTWQPMTFVKDCIA